MIANNNVLAAATGAEVTVPKDCDFKIDPVTFELTEYAADLGARVMEEYNDQQGKHHAIGETWVSGTQGHRLDDITTYWDAYYLPKDQVFVREVRAAGDDQVGVAACLVNPEDLGMDTQKINDHDVLTVNNRVVYYPQDRVRDTDLLRTLAECKAIADEHEEGAVNVYNLPRYQRDDNSSRGRVGCIPVPCYECQGNNFVHVNQQWYKCEPIQVSRQANGNIQFDKILFSAPHGSGRGANTLYAFLNDQFLSDLKNHSKAKLSQLQLASATAEPTCER